MTRFISNTYFQLLSIKEKGEHGTYNVKINVWKCNALYMNITVNSKYEYNSKYENNSMRWLMSK